MLTTDKLELQSKRFVHGKFLVIKEEESICNLIWGRLPLTHTTARHTFRHHMIAVQINQQYRQVAIGTEICQAAFAVACF